MAERQIKSKKRKYRLITDEDMDEAYKLGKTKKQQDRMIQKTNQDVRSMKKMCETKTTVLSVTASMVVAGLSQALTNLLQGTTSGNRVGSKVKSFSLRISGHLQLALNKVASMARIMVVIDFSQHGTKPLITDLFQSVGDFINNKPRNLVSGTSSSFKRLIVLYDEFWVLNNLTMTRQFDSNVILTPITRYKCHNWYRRVNHYIYYSGTSAAEADMDQGNMYVLSASGTDSAVTAVVQIVWKYTDS